MCSACHRLIFMNPYAYKDWRAIYNNICFKVKFKQRQTLSNSPERRLFCPELRAGKATSDYEPSYTCNYFHPRSNLNKVCPSGVLRGSRTTSPRPELTRSGDTHSQRALTLAPLSWPQVSPSLAVC